MKVEGQTTISGEDAAQVIATLNLRIATLNAELQQVRESAPQRAADVMRDALNSLRGCGVILLHNGEMREREIAERFASNPVALAAFNDASWHLDNAPLAREVIAEVRKATCGGMNRF